MFILGLVLGSLAMYLSSSRWSYLLYILSVIAFTFTDQVVKVFMIKKTEHFSVKDLPVNVEVRDKDGNIKSK